MSEFANDLSPVHPSQLSTYGWIRNFSDWPLRVPITVILFYAVGYKVVQSANILTGDGLLASPMLLAAVISFEFTAVVYILLGRALRVWSLSLLIFLVFFGAAVFAVSAGRDCNCFSGSIGAYTMMLIDSAVIAAILLVRPAAGSGTFVGPAALSQNAKSPTQWFRRTLLTKPERLCLCVGMVVFAHQAYRLNTFSISGHKLCREPVWDFGSVDPLAISEVKHTFRLENVTDQPVPIQKVRTTCGCMVTGDVPAFILPGDGAGITITTQLQGGPGPFQKSAFVELGSFLPSKPNARQSLPRSRILMMPRGSPCC